MKVFDDFVGQEVVKAKLRFHIDGHKRTNFFPNTLFTGPKGHGKTAFAQETAANLVRAGEITPKRRIFLNGPVCRHLPKFLDDVIVSTSINTIPTTLFIDEIQEVHPSILNWFLSVLAQNKDKRNEVRIPDGGTMVFDFRTFTFLGATTNPERLSNPLLDRLRRVDMQQYSVQNLAEILIKNVNGIEVAPNIAEIIAKCGRGSPRKVIDLADDIRQYMSQKTSNAFNYSDWRVVVERTGIQPLGLLANEIAVLRELAQESRTLTYLYAKLGMDRSAVQRGTELYLLKNDLINITGKREITEKGRKILKLCKI